MNSSNLKIYCVTNKKVDFVSKPEYNLSWVGTDETPKNYVSNIELSKKSSQMIG